MLTIPRKPPSLSRSRPDDCLRDPAMDEVRIATRPPVTLTGIEQSFGADELIVSKTDLKGRITYANQLFVSISGYLEAELIGAPHCVLRHPHMPRGVFRLLWETISSGREIFAYVVNRCKNGDHYWVFAHVTPTFDDGGKVIGYHSNRRTPERAKLAKIIPLYHQMLAAEKQHAGLKDQVAASAAMLQQVLAERSLSYDEFIFSL